MEGTDERYSWKGLQQRMEGPPNIFMPPDRKLLNTPQQTWDGKRAFGEHDYNLVYGPKGYCNVSEPDWGPNCGMDMFLGG